VDPLGLIRVSVADVRRAPDQRSEQVTQAIMGTVVTTLGQRGKWFQIRLPDGYEGWIHQGLLQLGDQMFVRRWSQEARVLVTVPWTMVYSRRARHADPVSDIVIGTKLCLVDESPRWLRVRLPDGRQGWLARQDTMRDAHLIHLGGGTREDILRLARRFRGIPYLWGGLTPKGFDCSGFVQTVFGLNGYALPRDACQQYRCGQPISSREDLIAADLLFFQGPLADRITHVAIHLSNEQFIHCSGFVKTNSINSSASDHDAFLEQHYVGARRIVGGINGAC
jgi:SH3-like domain-containing protein